MLVRFLGGAADAGLPCGKGFKEKTALMNKMIWPGTSDPYKRKKTIRFLIITAIIGVVAAAGSSAIQQLANIDNPLKVCIDDRHTPYKITATLELIVDGAEAEIPANVGNDMGCQRTMYTLSDDGVIYAEWEEVYPFEIGHFLWMWDFPLKDMNQDKSAIFVDDVLSSDFTNHPFIEGAHYKAVFTSKEYEAAKSTDFLPPDE